MTRQAGQMTMHDNHQKRTLKTLLVDIIMGLTFIFLLIVALWLVWIYYFRGPINIVTGKSKEADQELLIQAKKEYTKHFHNLDLVVVKGIQTGSQCLNCHGDYPHYKGQKVRALFNAHSWFIACEVCHVKPEESATVVYRWINNTDGNQLTRLSGENGDYGATIVPMKIENGNAIRIDNTEADFIREYMQTREQLDEKQKKAAEEKMHETMRKDPVYCDECHTQNGIFHFEELLYSPQSAMYLETLDMGAMAKTYKEFHLPSIFDK